LFSKNYTTSRCPLKIRSVSLLFLVFLSIGLYAQQEKVVVDRISISGNEHTKPEVIFRELLFELGDSIPVDQLSDILQRSKEFLVNTGLFTRVEVYFKNWEAITNKIHVQVDVQEAWYIFPVPIFEWVDRNFNVWWVEQQRDLNRINLGIDFTHINLTGRRDRLNFQAKYGYVRQYGLKYAFPYLNKAKTLGLEGGVSYQRRREVYHLTQNSKQMFFSDRDRFIYQRFSSRLGLSYRPGHRSIHEWGLSYNRKNIASIVYKQLNPLYFANGSGTERSISLSYAYTYDDRDVRAYPLKGFYFQGKITKLGLGIFKDKNLLFLALRHEFYHQFSDRWSTGYDFYARTTPIRNQPPFEDSHIMGSSGTTVPGYEYYILDGIDAVMLRALFRYKFMDNELRLGKLMPFETFKVIPFRVFLRLSSGWGYANDPFDTGVNPLNKTVMWGGGPALDIVVFNDIVFRFEYSFNHLGEKGLFLHFKSNL
jgi:outer membrane protein assembly factor BamA